MQLFNQNIRWSFIILFLISGCANVSTPTGGPKDERPPQILEMNPRNAQTDFDAPKITLVFDEFIQLKDLKKQFIISPPTEEDPKVLVKGKKLEITLPDSLTPETTYNLFFGNAIQDYNEGNPLANFRYVFSTGSTIDSMAIKGSVVSAFDKLPQENTVVMLYKNFTDSTPMKDLPNYVANIDEEGEFNMAYLAKDTFTLFALVDENKNYLYDEGEAIAFSDSLITFEMKTLERVDTVFHAADSTQKQTHQFQQESENTIDTIIRYSYRDYPVNHYDLYTYTEPLTNQYITEFKRDIPHLLTIVLNTPPKDSLQITPLEGKEKPLAYKRVDSENLDSIWLWLTDTTHIHQEVVEVKATYDVLIERGEYLSQTDTLSFSYFFTEKDTLQPLKASFSLKKQMLDLQKDLLIKFPTAIKATDTAAISLSLKVDTLWHAIDYTLESANKAHTKFRLAANWQPDSSYRLLVEKGAFTDYYYQQNDSLGAEFKVQTLDHYGKLLINVPDTLFKPLLLQLWDKNEKNMYRQLAFEPNKKQPQAVMELVEPGEYKLKIVVDKNRNGQWDAGDLYQRKQPEKVFYHPELLKVRSNWDLEVNLEFTKML
ncbi:MAG: Ig-like domain-containing protein [Bacteroidota bacterium]